MKTLVRLRMDATASEEVTALSRAESQNEDGGLERGALDSIMG
jgi:hypothetical protein